MIPANVRTPAAVMATVKPAWSIIPKADQKQTAVKAASLTKNNVY
jgi:hypothetical protein